MQALKVTFHLRRPVVEQDDRPLHLDALLTAGRARQLELAGDEDAWTNALDLSSLLAREQDIWKASWLFAQSDRQRESVVEQHILVRRSGSMGGYYEALAAGHYTHNAKDSWTLNSGSGPFKAFMLPLNVRHVLSYTAWAVGDAQEITQTLSHIKSIGKVRRNGYGEIDCVEIESAPAEEAEHWRLRTLREGMTPLDGMPYAQTYSTVTAPYWQRANRVAAIEPIGVL